MKAGLYILMLCFLCITAQSQENDRQKIEQYFLENETEISEIESTLELIDALANKKIPLLTAEIAEIAQLPTINLVKAREIKKLLRNRPSIGTDELIREAGLSDIQAAILRTCAEIAFGTKERTEAKNYVKFRAIADRPLQKTRGLENGKYQGDNFGLNNKLRMSIGGYGLGFASDKDVGETSYVDNFAGYATANFGSHGVIIGNFKINSGFGLALGNSFCTSKYSALLTSDAEIDNNISPDLSAYNAKTFRGAAVSGGVALSKGLYLSYMAFGSSAERAATMNDSGKVTSLYTSNLFRTESEIAKKNVLGETALGGLLQATTRNFSAMYSAFSMRYDRDVMSESAYMIRGKSAVFQSVAMQYWADSLCIGGEIAESGGEFAGQVLAKYYVPKSVFSANFRYFSDDYRAPFGTNIFENTYLNNEVGAGFAVARQMDSLWTLEFMADYFETLRSTYSVDFPVKGLDLEARAFITLNESTELGARLEYENKNDGSSGVYKLRIDCDFNSKEGGSHHLRCDVSRSAETGGLLLYEQQRKLFKGLTVGGSVAVFSTDSYDSACYLLNTFANSSAQIKPLYMKGVFGRFDLEWNLYKDVDLQLQYMIVHKPNEETLGSGLETISDNTEQEIRLSLGMKNIFD